MTVQTDLFNKIEEAISDLQAADLQSYHWPLKRLDKLLSHDDLKQVNAELTAGVDLDAFIQAGQRSMGSMVGSARLPWPEDERECLGIQLLLIRKFSKDPDYMFQFGFNFFYAGSNVLANARAVLSQVIIPFARDYKSYVLSHGKAVPRLVPELSDRVFIVHGHDGEARETLARFLTSLELRPVILHEQPNMGRTIIEKVEDNSDVGFAVVLLTPDDLGRSKKDDQLEARPRQNVLLELGYFLGRLGRPRVCALKKGELEIPSDFAGVVWEPMDQGSDWKFRLFRELHAAGYKIDANRLIR